MTLWSKLVKYWIIGKPSFFSSILPINLVGMWNDLWVSGWLTQLNYVEPVLLILPLQRLCVGNSDVCIGC